MKPREVNKSHSKMNQLKVIKRTKTVPFSCSNYVQAISLAMKTEQNKCLSIKFYEID